MKYDKETFEEMINDWKADSSEMDDLEIDKIMENEDNLQEWIAYCHDKETSYSLTDDGSGNIKINYLGTR